MPLLVQVEGHYRYGYADHHQAQNNYDNPRLQRYHVVQLRLNPFQKCRVRYFIVMPRRRQQQVGKGQYQGEAQCKHSIH